MNEGQFFCPQCAGPRSYKHKKVTTFFTLYFIPLIPLGRKGDYVECQSCKNTFVQRVLELEVEESRPTTQAAPVDQSPASAGRVEIPVESGAGSISLAATQNASNEDFLSEKQKAIKKLLIMMILADGRVEDAEIHMFHKVYRQTADKVVGDIYREIELVKNENLSPKEYLKGVAALLNDEGKEAIIRSSMMIAASDGDIDDSEVEMIHQFGKALDMSSAQVKLAMQI